ncbi:MAG: hypothetical protein ABWK01_03610 [Infirmifilum sp.]
MFLPEGDVFVFDVDGVLVDSKERLRRALSEVGVGDDINPHKLEPRLRQKFWQRFLSEELLVLDRPRELGIKLLLERLGVGVILVLTGRPYRLYHATIRQLSGFGVPVDKVILSMRPNVDKRRDAEFKASVLARIPHVVEVHDDEEEVLLKARSIHPEARLFLHYDNKYREL